MKRRNNLGSLLKFITMKRRNNLGSLLKSITIIFLFAVFAHNYLSCSIAAAGEPAVKKPKSKEPTIEERIAVLEKQVQQIQAAEETQQKKLLTAYMNKLSELNNLAEENKANAGVVVKRLNDLLHRDRLERASLPPYPSIADKVKKGHEFVKLGQENEAAVQHMKGVLNYINRERFRQLQENQDEAYRIVRAELKRKHDAKIAKVEEQKIKLEKSWSYKWYKTKQWTGEKYDTVCGWFGGGDEKEPVAVANAKK